MAQFVPEGWKPSATARNALAMDYRAIHRLVSQRARKFFDLSAIQTSDLVQEGLIAATYALDSYQPTRGKRDAYIGTVVDNALAMVAAESRAQCRQPYTFVQDEDSRTGDTVWRRVPLSEPIDPDFVEADITLAVSETREAGAEHASRMHACRSRLLAFRRTLSPLVARLHDLRLSPPIELLVMTRNLVGRNVSSRTRIPNQVLSQYLGVSVDAIARSTRDLREALAQHFQVVSQ